MKLTRKLRLALSLTFVTLALFLLSSINVFASNIPNPCHHLNNSIRYRSVTTAFMRDCYHERRCNQCNHLISSTYGGFVNMVDGSSSGCRLSHLG